MLPLIPLLVSLLPPTIPPQASEVWEFQGIEVHAKVGCVNDPTVEARHTWIRKGEGYRAERQALREDLRQKHGPLVGVTTFSVTVGKPREIALVRKTLRCNQYSGPPKRVQSYRWHAGADREAILRDLESDVRTVPGVEGYEVVRWIDVAGELARLSADRGGYRTVLTQAYGPLEVTFTSGRTARGSMVVHLRATNTDPARAVLMQLTEDGRGVTSPVLLQPGEQFSGPIDTVHGFGLQIQFKDPDEPRQDLFDMLKALIRDEITVRDGRLRRTGDGSSGVRG